MKQTKKAKNKPIEEPKTRIEVPIVLAKNKPIEEPKTRIEVLMAFSALLFGFIYINIYQNLLHIKADLFTLQTLFEQKIPLVLIFSLIYYIFVKIDPLQRSPSRKKSIRFFQNEFPSKYLLERCEKCIEDERSCANFIKAESYSHIRYWFYDIFHGAIEKENPRVVKDTFEKGYICKLHYYLSGILVFFSALGILTIAIYLLCLYLLGDFKFDLSPLQILFPFVCTGIIILLKVLNKPDEIKPSGCWQAWREINGIHRSWLASHEELLVELICHANGGTKKFKKK